MIYNHLQLIYNQLTNPNNSNRVAAKIGTTETSYGDFARLIFSKAASLEKLKGERIAIWTENHIDTYATILASWLSGKSYIPIHTQWPIDRIQKVLEIGKIDYFYSREEIPYNVPPKKIKADELNTQSHFLFKPQLINKEAYILFTSGSTGEPKGVPITHENLDSFYEGFLALNYQLNQEDRFLQMFELTFDLSISSFMIPLTLGASFYTLNNELIKPLALFEVLDNEDITFALMVPSVIQLLLPYKDEIHLPKLKYTQFCGEPLYKHQVESWKICAPQSQIDNVYGPTEATIYCTRYTAYPSEICLENKGIVCIGKPLKNTAIRLIDNELWILGTQLFNGYLNPNQNNGIYTVNNGVKEYRSGDIGSSQNGEFFCNGRNDLQVKINGYRIELNEIEHQFSLSFNHKISVAITKENDQQMNEIILFVEKDPNLSEGIIAKCLSSNLPSYMLPSRIIMIDKFLYNVNGKLDRNALKNGKF